MRFDFALSGGAWDTIQQLIVFAKAWNYTTLVPQFEGVVRTKSLHYLSSASTYSTEQMTRLVDLAGEAGLSVAPVVGTLGYAEHLVEGPELRPLLRGGADHKHMFCPSSEAVYERLEQYFAELAELFHGENVHIGGDESWALGACPLCRERLRRGEATEDLFIGHLLRLHEILHRLGKRTWMWDDPFEDGDLNKISRIPRDVVICSEAVRGSADSVSSQRPGEAEENPFRRYSDLGFDVIGCPWARSMDDISRVTELSEAHPLLGGLVTVWDLTTSFWPTFLPRGRPMPPFSGRARSGMPMRYSSKRWGDCCRA